jgi:hypothetical protein
MNMYKLCYLYSVINSYLVLHFLLMGASRVPDAVVVWRLGAVAAVVMGVVAFVAVVHVIVEAVECYSDGGKYDKVS